MGLQITMPYSCELLVSLFVYISIKFLIWPHVSTFGLKYYTLFISPILVGCFLYNVPVLSAASMFLGAWALYTSVCCMLLPLIDAVSQKAHISLQLRCKSNETAASVGPFLGCILRKCFLSQSVCAFLSFLIDASITSFTVRSTHMKTLTFSAAFLLLHALLLLLSWLRMILCRNSICPTERYAQKQVSMICMALPFVFVGKIFYAISVLFFNGHATEYAHLDKGLELFSSCFFVAVPLQIFLHIATRYPFVISYSFDFQKVHLSSIQNASKIDVDRQQEYETKVQLLRIALDIIISFLTIISFRLGSGHTIGYMITSCAIFQVLNALLLEIQLSKYKCGDSNKVEKTS